MAQNHANNSNPADKFFTITPSDLAANNFAHVTRGIYVGSIASGTTLTVVGSDNVAVQFTGVSAGTVLPLRCIRVNSTGTLASSLVGLY